MACAIYDALNVKYFDVNWSTLEKMTQDWLKNEVNHWQECMYSCSLGQQITRTKTFPFPRIVRVGDSRGKIFRDTEHRSAIAKFLFAFDRHWENDTSDRFEMPSLNEDLASKNLKTNYETISNLIQNISNNDWYKDNDPDMIDIDWVTKKQTKQLFRELPTIESEKNKILNDIRNTKDVLVHDIVRTLLFASYLFDYITLTKVVALDEYAAFDIFDALNTTGEPLTALETLKPAVLRYEHERIKQRNLGTGASDAFKETEKYLEEKLGDKEHQRQDETKDLVITFALYWSGRKLSKDLAAQRSYLRQQFQTACGQQIRHEEFTNAFLDSLRKVSKFRRYYWDPEGINEINLFHTEELVDEIKLLMSFILSMKTSLTLPVLARYWNEKRHTVVSQKEFLLVLRAVVAFIVLRRGFTGGTDGIDSDFRQVMEESHFALCRVLDQKDEPKSVEELKKISKHYLRESSRRM